MYSEPNLQLNTEIHVNAIKKFSLFIILLKK